VFGNNLDMIVLVLCFIDLFDDYFLPVFKQLLQIIKILHDT